MSNKNLFLDIHVLQAVPPSNLNRDDTGSPKTAQYGGVTRARVSSQSWKSAMRKYFNDNGADNVGIRSKNIPEYIADEIIKLDMSKSKEEALKLACMVIESAGIKTADSKLKALFFIGKQQAKNLAKIALEDTKDKAAIKKALESNVAVDIALFGRMVADDPSLNEDASSQVAHAISTHAISTEFDFFTAADDLAPEDNAGAGMLGTVEFNSSLLYRYANVAVHELYKQLNDDKVQVKNAAGLFVESFVKSMPTGKINTFANQTLPQFIMINLRNDRPVNLVSAYESPIKARNGYSKESIKALLDEFEKSGKFVNEPILTLIVNTVDIDGIVLNGLKNNLSELLNELKLKLESDL